MFSKRKISDSEWLYIYFHEMYNDFCIQIVVEGNGKIDEFELKSAVKKVSAINNFVRAKKNGLYWVDSGKSPEVILHSCDLSVFLEHTNSNKYVSKLNESVSCIHYFPKSGHLLFQVFHGVMDGRGVLNFIQNIFKALNKQTALVVLNSNTNDKQFVKSIKSKGKKIHFNFTYKSVARPINLHSYHTGCKIIQLSQVHDTIVPRICYALHHSLSVKKSNWMIPVDLRRHKKNIKCDANLTLPIFLKIQTTDSYSDVKGNYLMSLKNSDEVCASNAKIWGISFLPSAIIRYVINILKKILIKRQRFPISGIVSFIEKSDLQNYSTECFKAIKMIALPCVQPFTPITIMVSMDTKNINLVFGYYRAWCSEAQINDFINLFNTNFKNLHYE